MAISKQWYNTKHGGEQSMVESKVQSTAKHSWRRAMARSKQWLNARYGGKQSMAHSNQLRMLGLMCCAGKGIIWCRDTTRIDTSAETKQKIWLYCRDAARIDKTSEILQELWLYFNGLGFRSWPWCDCPSTVTNLLLRTQVQIPTRKAIHRRTLESFWYTWARDREETVAYIWIDRCKRERTNLGLRSTTSRHQMHRKTERRHMSLIHA